MTGRAQVLDDRETALWEPSSILGVAFLVVVGLTVAGTFLAILFTAIYLMHA
jgi:hypothetical protein